VFLILTGGEPLLRRDIWDLAAYAAERRFTTVLGTNGVLLREPEAKLMRAHGVLGASISLDSTDRVKHDTFRHLPGAWDGAVRAALPTDPVGAGPVVAAAPELRPRLVSRGQALLSHHARGRRDAVPLHAGVGGEPQGCELRRALARGTGLRRPARPEARRAL